MGSCVSSHKSMKPAVKRGKKDDKVLVKERPNTANGAESRDTKPAFSSSGLDGGGSKDEAFFDSQPWLDSDCENDFYSVNGDHTPSCGSTPVHHSFHSSQQPASKPSILLLLQTEDTTSAPEPSPTEGRKKRLSELFSESFGGDEQYTELPASSHFQQNHLRDAHSESSTPNKETRQCCIPVMIRGRSMNGTRR